MKQITKPLKIVGTILIGLSLYFTGYLVGHKNLVFEENYSPKIINKELAKPKEVDFGIFWNVWDKINKNYVGQIDNQKMIYGAIAGMVDALGDPYSGFMEPDNLKSFMEDLSGKLEGIGAEITLKNKKIMIVSPLKDSPAQKNGLKPGDQIVKINNESTEDMSLEAAIGKIRGKAGTKVNLEIYREASDEFKNFEITRQRINIQSVEWEMKGEIGYIKASQFGDDTTGLMREAAEEIKSKNPKAIILDLRNNPGGYLDAAVDMVSIFQKDGVVVKEQFKDGRKDEQEVSGDTILENIKMVILINGGSASASEIVAGALQDRGLAILIGEKTFGKGSVQTLEDLSGGAALRLTTAKWLTPKDRAINGTGIEPDINITLTDEDQKDNRDPQLDRALELLK